MLEWLSSQKRLEKRKAARDAKLREALAVKARQFDNEVRQAVEDFTEITINGLRQKVPVDRITVIDVVPMK